MGNQDVDQRVRDWVVGELTRRRARECLTDTDFFRNEGAVAVLEEILDIYRS